MYSKPAGTTAVAGTIIESAKYNSVVDDIAADLNLARPVVAGGTGATSVSAAQTSLSVDNKVTYVTKSADYTAIGTDNNAAIRCTAALTLSLTAAVTLGSGWHLTVKADGGDVSVDPNGSETINGGATLTIKNNQTAYIICNGTAFFAFHFPATNAENSWTADQTFTGITFGSTFASGGAQDLSDHIKLYSTTYGFCVTSGALNYNVPSGADHAFYNGSNRIARVISTGIQIDAGFNFTGTATSAFDIAGGSLRESFTTAPSFSSSTGQGFFYSAGSRELSISKSGGSLMSLQRTTSDGPIVAFFRQTTQVGSISVTAAATAYNTSSDYRLKYDLTPLDGSGAFIDALKPWQGKWRVDDSKFVGFIAHEFAKVSPTSVTGKKDDVDKDGNPIYQAMQASSSEVMANIIAELQSLRKRVASLEDAA